MKSNNITHVLVLLLILNLVSVKAILGQPKEPVLQRVELITHSGDDGKDKNTGVYAKVYGTNITFASIENADCSEDDKTEYKGGTWHTIVLNILEPQTTKDIISKFKYYVRMKPKGKDDWEFTSWIKLFFSDGTSTITKSRYCYLGAENSQLSGFCIYPTTKSNFKPLSNKQVKRNN